MNKFRTVKSDGNRCIDMFVGVDLHKNYLQVAVIQGNGLRDSGISNDL
ncbi:MAG: hypothetical protein ACJ71M_10915 [Nitrososphaeraceae archaeon]